MELEQKQNWVGLKTQKWSETKKYIGAKKDVVQWKKMQMEQKHNVGADNEDDFDVVHQTQTQIPS